MYITEVLERFDMSDCKPLAIPIDANVKLVKPDGKSLGKDRKLLHREFVGAFK